MRHKTLIPRQRTEDHLLARWPLSPRVEDLLTWNIQSSEQLDIISAAGELDISTAPSLGGHLKPLADAGRHLILDLAGVRFCDCAGLSSFLKLQEHATAADGSLQLAAPTAMVRRVITLTQLSDVLLITASTADAIAALEVAANERAAAPRVAENGDECGRDSRPAPLPDICAS
jgi:anti-sigma B factor antagonist